MPSGLSSVSAEAAAIAVSLVTYPAILFLSLGVGIMVTSWRIFLLFAKSVLNLSG